ncbi:MAG TPA: AraC family transcriptional regulator [Marinobacter sp.]|nr:AraC family transcriptional regulator [Marinobacter sp.]
MMFGIRYQQQRWLTLPKVLAHCLLVVGLLLPMQAMSDAIDNEISQLRANVSEHSAKVFALEQKLLHPVDTRIAVFLKLASRDSLDLDSVELFVNGKPVTSHLYSDRERGSLDEGGIQQLFTGNLPNGSHELKAVITARSAKNHFVRREALHRFQKRPGTLRLQMSLEARAPDYEPQVSFVEWK